ncbi:rRNA N6-adenosine-methyltransferase ZCCHC4 isoform X2 [Planococcus citri]|uniref:rRNA N6-adenosine-methyltransferase ZCCHC4 isoform X2 n=2 Tax=Planococcus citri TaxID=170843 RepID=UPI0031F7F2EF
MVDYCPTDISNNPSCPHGPSVLFCKKNSSRKFFACSAYRSRKRCPFFLWEDDLKKQKQATKNLTSQFEFRKLEKLTELPNQDRNWCHCCELLFPAKEKLQHNKHKTEIALSDEVLSQPSMLFTPKEESKEESQYYFSDTVVTTIVGFLRNLNVTSVICLGCPRLHEYILRNNVMKSMLLDIDTRYVKFYNPDEFQPFNMFNSHAFDVNGWINIERFVTDSNKIAIIADPPFGGQTDPLAYTFKRLESLTKDNNVIEFLILPYFMEPFVLKSFPNFSMLDYKVVYVNHRKFKKLDSLTGSSKSAVRIFTNVEPSKFKLPEDEYKYCSVCDRWVCKENQHCDKCNACTSKNGAAYKHCNLCEKCVKNTWKHCDICGFCKLIEHRCTPALNKKENNIIKRKIKSPKKKKNKKARRNQNNGNQV